MARGLGVCVSMLRGLIMANKVPLRKHVYKVSFIDKTSVRVMAFDEPDAKIMAEKLRPDAAIKKVEKIAD